MQINIKINVKAPLRKKPQTSGQGFSPELREDPVIGSQAHRHENKMIELWGNLLDSINLKMNIKKHLLVLKSSSCLEKVKHLENIY